MQVQLPISQIQYTCCIYNNNTMVISYVAPVQLEEELVIKDSLDSRKTSEEFSTSDINRNTVGIL